MSVLVSESKKQIEKILLSAAEKAIKNGELPESELAPFKVEVPSDRKNGDYAVNAAMVWARGFMTRKAILRARQAVQCWRKILILNPLVFYV